MYGRWPLDTEDQARRSQGQAHRKISIIPGRTNRNIPNIMRDPPCARQVAPDPIQSLLSLNLSLAESMGYVIWPPKEEARPALRKAGRTQQLPHRKKCDPLSTGSGEAKDKEHLHKVLAQGGARQVALGSSLAQGRSPN